MPNKIVRNTAKPPAAGKGRPKGSKNKTTGILKASILKAADEAGGKDGLVGYLKTQAIKYPGPFLALLGKVLPPQKDDGEGLSPVTAVQINIVDVNRRDVPKVISGHGNGHTRLASQRR